ncbi:glucan biosynthesis protein [Acidisphaera sp. L21]|uniref:glucan biosynthesis protein n=1 Tax=Acidisphaera sp. L21 TaxID=1641851 RepID=UPI00131C23DD|nr:glucan biosynthesis protein G [Acidisphaera sp. L21]
MQRRDLLAAAAALPAVLAARPSLAAPDTGTAFSAATVRDAARDLASRPFQAQETGLPGYLANIGYDQYRMLRFDKRHALWRDTKLPWQVEFFHRGSIYKGRIDVNEVVDGRSAPVRYNPEEFSFGSVQRPTNEDLGYAGFRLHAPLNRPDYFDEVAAFLGASYFRAVAKGLGYGLSARGLAIKTADPGGEEFPYFKTFWIERPKPGKVAQPITVYALLDSQSAAAAFKFVISPGVDTVFETTVTLFPRVDIDQAGIAPLTSMFLFDGNERNRVDDWRPAVHDSDGLLMLTGRGETLWRQLDNPTRLQVSSFMDKSPKGFGLQQRKRSFAGYEDIESRYENRPCAWIEPIGDWGEGSVMLVEIPSDKEVNDNIVAFWRPKSKLQAGVAYNYAYRLHWCAAPPVKGLPTPFTNTMVGPGPDGSRLVVLDLAPLKPGITPKLDVTNDKGQLRNLTSTEIPGVGWRISFELVPGRETAIELHGRLMAGDTPLTETWLYRWTT